MNYKSLLISILGGILLFSLAIPVGAQGNPFLSPPEEETPSFLGAFIQKPAASRGANQLSDWSIALQRTLRELLVEVFPHSGQPFTWKAFFLFLGAPFLYGLLHAAGPGHRKTVLIAWFAGRPATPRQALGAGFFFSFLHGGSALILVAVAQALMKRSLTQGVDRVSLYMEFFSYLSLFLVGLALMAAHIQNLIGKKGNSPDSGANETPSRGSRSLWALLFLSGIVPCPGALIILIFSLTQGAFGWGALAVTAMSLGMAATLSAVALISRGGRSLLTRSRINPLWGRLLTTVSILLIMLFGLFMAYPYCNWQAFPLATASVLP